MDAMTHLDIVLNVAHGRETWKRDMEEEILNINVVDVRKWRTGKLQI
jgi:hypothetical protein